MIVPGNVQFIHRKIYTSQKNLGRNLPTFMYPSDFFPQPYFDIRPPRDVSMSLLDEVGPCKAVERDEEARLGRIRGSVKERENVQKLRNELFTKQHFSLTRTSTV